MASRSDYEQAMEAVEELHPAAQVLAKAAQKIKDPNVEVDELVDLLKTDPSLTADVIRMSNSAFYSYATPAKDLGSAISRIGFSELLKLVGLSISKSLFAQDLLHYNITALDYWSDSVSTALLMEVIGQFINVEAQEGYTVGLLHAVGKVVIDQVLDIMGEEAYYDPDLTVTEWERSVLGFDHAFAGSVMLKRWDFPEEIPSCCLYQFKPEKAETPSPFLHPLNFCIKMIEQTGYGFVNDNIELDETMENFIIDNNVDEDGLIDSLVQASENFITIQNDLGIT